MTKNNPKGASNTRDKAREMRETQKKRDTRVRNLLVAIVSLVVVAVVVTVIAVVVNSNNKNDGQVKPLDPPQSQPQSQSQSRPQPRPQAGEILPIKDGGPIIISDLGVGNINPDLPNFDLYFSYTCHWCAYLEVAVGEKLVADAEAGKYNLLLHPVSTASMDYIGPATNAAITVAQEDPENFPAFHQALMAFADQEINQKQDGTIVMNLDASRAEVQKIAKDVGVSQDVISQFGDDADEYIQISQNEWIEREVIGRDGDGLGTPELIFDGTVVPWGQGTPTQIYDSIMAEIQNIQSTGSND